MSRKMMKSKTLIFKSTLLAR